MGWHRVHEDHKHTTVCVEENERKVDDPTGHIVFTI